MIEAYDEFDAVARIKQTCPIVISIKEVQGRGAKDLFSTPRISSKKLALICSQFAIILGAGLPTVRTVELVAEQTADKALRGILKSVAGDVAAGNSLADSFENKGKGLPPTFIETVRAGEESGTLDDAFRTLHTYFDKSAKTSAKVTSALIYPAFLVVISIIVVAVIMIRVIPVFVTMFSSMDMALPLPTRIIISISNFMVRYWLVILGVIVAAVFALLLWSKTPAGMKYFATLRLKLPLFGRIERMNGASQFAGTMSTLLGAGMPITRALTITAKVMNNYVLGLEVRDMVSGIEEGAPLGDCMRRSPWFDNLLTEMTGVGEQTGSLENTLSIIGDFFDNEVQVSTSRILAMLEPTIIVLMAIGVVLVVFGFYMPMFEMYGGMGG